MASHSEEKNSVSAIHRGLSCNGRCGDGEEKTRIGTQGVKRHRVALISRLGGSQLSVLASQGPWLLPLPRALTGDWAEQRNVQTSDLVGWTLKPSGLGGLLLPPGKALDQGNSLKKVFGSRAAGGWPPSRDADG